LRDQGEIEGRNKKAFNSGKTGNEGILRIPMKTVHQAGLILLFAEKLTEVPFGRDERKSNRYPDFGLKPYSRLPEL
jgi:hypothetical protein